MTSSIYFGGLRKEGKRGDGYLTLSASNSCDQLEAMQETKLTIPSYTSLRLNRQHEDSMRVVILTLFPANLATLSMSCRAHPSFAITTRIFTEKFLDETHFLVASIASVE